MKPKFPKKVIILTESQLIALERAKEKKAAHGKIEAHHPCYLGAQDTYYVGNIKGVRHIYQQTFIDTYSKVATAKLYDRKIALVAANMLNDRVIPIYERHRIPLMRILTDRGTEYCDTREHHEFQLYLAIEELTISKPKLKVLKQMVFVNAFIEQYRKNFMQWLLERKYTEVLRKCKRI